MTEFLLNTKIFHEAAATSAAQTGDNSLIIVLLIIAVLASAIFVFKKKCVKVVLSIVLAFSFMIVLPKQAFADSLVTITPSSGCDLEEPATITITNNDEYAITINSIEIANQIMATETTWDICIQKDSYELNDINNLNFVSFDIPAHSSLDIYVNPNAEDELPVGELCNLCFVAVSSHYKATYKNTEDDVTATNEFNFSFASLEKADQTVENRDIATLLAAFACIPNTYNNLILDGFSYGVDNRIAFMRTLGFTDNIYCKLWPNTAPTFDADPGVSINYATYTKDENDVTSFSFNHRKINFGSHFTEVINISVGATGGDFEWASNFDFGAKTADYEGATGTHEEWTSFADHKGFDIAKNRLMTSYESYYNKYIDKSSNVNKIILINGHSRGGGIANLLGRDFEDSREYKSFTYTFASPNTTTYEQNSEYHTIYNILNKDDLVCQFPGYISGFCKYGKELGLSVSEDTSITGSPMYTVFENTSGYGEYEGPSPQEVSDLIDKTGALIANRNDAYTLKADSSKDYFKLNGSYDTREKAVAAIEQFKSDLIKYRLNYYAEVEEQPVRIGDTFHIQFKACAAFLMQDISNWLFLKKYSEPFLGYNKELIEVLKEALGVVPGVVHGHIWMSYNTLAKYDQY